MTALPADETDMQIKYTRTSYNYCSINSIKGLFVFIVHKHSLENKINILAKHNVTFTDNHDSIIIK